MVRALCNRSPVYPALMPALTPLPALRDNYIWTLTGTNGCAVIVDPGEADPVRSALERGVRPEAILLTHHHADHIGGAFELAQDLGIPVFAPLDPRIEGDCLRVREGDSVRLPNSGLRFTVFEVPGHTLSHVAYVGEGVAFTGDTLFSLGCGRLFEGTPAQMLESLGRLAALPPETRICCGHEYTLSNAAFALAADPENRALHERFAQARAMQARGEPTLPVTLAVELETNPFLRCAEPQLAARIAARDGVAANDTVAVFAALRRWKDGFAG